MITTAVSENNTIVTSIIVFRIWCGEAESLILIYLVFIKFKDSHEIPGWTIPCILAGGWIPRTIITTTDIGYRLCRSLTYNININCNLSFIISTLCRLSNGECNLAGWMACDSKITAIYGSCSNVWIVRSRICLESACLYFYLQLTLVIFRVGMRSRTWCGAAFIWAMNCGSMTGAARGWRYIYE